MSDDTERPMTTRVCEGGRWVTKDVCPDTGKVKHQTRADCDRQVRFFSEGNTRRRHGQGKTRKAAVAYRCGFCDGWHVGIGGGR